MLGGIGTAKSPYNLCPDHALYIWPLREPLLSGIFHDSHIKHLQCRVYFPEPPIRRLFLHDACVRVLQHQPMKAEDDVVVFEIVVRVLVVELVDVVWIVFLGKDVFRVLVEHFLGFVVPTTCFAVVILR